MVRGMPLKLMHFRPTSRISSAAATGVVSGCEAATACRIGSESGELSVNVEAAYQTTEPSVTSDQIRGWMGGWVTYRNGQPRARAEAAVRRIPGNRCVDITNGRRRRRRARPCEWRVNERFKRLR